MVRVHRTVCYRAGVPDFVGVDIFQTLLKTVYVLCKDKHVAVKRAN